MSKRKSWKCLKCGEATTYYDSKYPCPFCGGVGTMKEIKQPKAAPKLSEYEGMNIYLSGKERSIIWDSLYGSRAAGRYEGRPEDKLIVNNLLHSKLRVI